MKSSVALSLKLNISRIVIGMTVVSFVTSSPELIVSIQAAISGYSNIAVGNAIGSNIANIGFVLSIVLLISPISVQDSFRRFDWPMMIASSLIFALMISYDNKLSRLEGFFLFSLLFFFIYYLLKKKYNKNYNTQSFVKMTYFKIIVYLFLGSFCLWSGSELLIDCAVKLGSILGVSDRIISITVVAFGTSVPELATSIIAVIKNEKAISLGNLIGSNIFNILAVLGITSIIQPIYVTEISLINNDIFMMIAISILLFPLVMLKPKMKLGRNSGYFLLFVYVVFIYTLLK
tara:strand:- start:33593 stop:34462 length:870 start_codon:yes stop_codon:yes gene_type:complete